MLRGRNSNYKLFFTLCILFTISFVGTILNYLNNRNNLTEMPFRRGSPPRNWTRIAPSKLVLPVRKTTTGRATKPYQDRKPLSTRKVKEPGRTNTGVFLERPTTPGISFIRKNENFVSTHVNRGDSKSIVLLSPGPENTEEVRPMLERNNTVEDQKIRETFKGNWCRLQRTRVDWKAYLKTCENHTVWEKKNNHDNWKPTDPRKSFVASWEIFPAGDFSRFFIQTMTATNRTKSTGGDAWRIHLRGPSSLAPTVIDLGNGKYEVNFLLLESGTYRAEIFLDYTLCNGLTDPPDDWFIKGNSQGKNQPEGILLGNKPYLLATFRAGEQVEFFVPSRRNGNSPTGLEITPKQSSCENTCGSLLWDGFGRWAAGEWKPYEQVPAPKRRDPRKNEGTLWIFGDSVANGFHASLTTGPYKELCSHVFTSCQKVYHWVYDMKGYWGNGVTSPREPVPDGKDYDHERILKDIRKILFHPKMNGKSVLILNLGIHYAAAVNFTNYKRLIDDVIRIAQNGDTDPEDGQWKQFSGRLIWKTTTALNRHRFPSPHKDVRRFLTFPRVELYNAYATSAMCRAGIDVIDVYPISNSFPGGTVAPNDPVHYSGHVFRDVERLLFEMFRP